MTPQTFAASPIRMIDVRHPDGWFPRIRRWIDAMFADYGEDWRRQSRRNRWALYCGRAAEDFEAIGDDQSASANRRLAMGAMQ